MLALIGESHNAVLGQEQEMKTKTQGSKNLKGGLRCDVCGKKANVSHYKIGTKCFKHLPPVGA
jgi:hypothetical protein